MNDNERPRLKGTGLAELFAVSVKVGLISFGGPAAQIAILQDEFVDRRKWTDQGSFLRALNFCMLLPGPEAQQLATYLGYRVHGLFGGIVAGGLFVLPGALVMLGLAILAAAKGDWPPLQAIFHGLLPMVVALVLAAVWRIGGRTLKTAAAWVLAVGSLVAVQLHVPFPLVVLVALISGVVLDRFGIAAGAAGHPEDGAAAPGRSLTTGALLRRTAAYAVTFVVLWAAPILILLALFGSEPFLEVALLFSKAAFITFGGAYAVLPYIADASVNQYGWLSREAMIHGLALAETTPGPLILVTEYVGFFAGWNGADHANLPPLAAGIIAAAVTLWCTFLPSIFLVLIGAPLIETLTHDRRAAAALAGVTSAVVGVIASLAIVIGRAAFFPQAQADFIAMGLGVAAFLVLLRFRPSPMWLVAAGGIAGLVRWQTGF